MSGQLSDGSLITQLTALLAAITGFLGGLVLFIPKVQAMIREIRRPDTADYKAVTELKSIIRRVVRALKGKQAWDELDEKLRKDLERNAR